MKTSLWKEEKNLIIIKIDSDGGLIGNAPDFESMKKSKQVTAVISSTCKSIANINQKIK